MSTRAFNRLPIGGTFLATWAGTETRLRKVSASLAQPVGPGAGPLKNFQGSTVRLEEDDERRAQGLTLLAKMRELEAAFEDAGLDDASDWLYHEIENEVEDAFGLTMDDLAPPNPNDYEEDR